MPKPLYEQSAQLGNLSVAPDPGYDVIPGNVLKVAFVLLKSTFFTAVTVKTGAAWQTAVTKADNHADLVVVTPFIDSFEISPTTLITEGGNDTTTANGVPRGRSISFAEGKGKLSGVSAEQIAALRKMAAKSTNYQHGTRLGMYLLHEGSGISVVDEFKPIPVYNVFFSDPVKGGKLGASNDCDMTFHLDGGWGLTEKVVQADFVVSTLVNAPAGA